MSRFSKKCDNSTLARRCKIVVENAATTEIRRAGMPMMYFEKKGRLEIDFMANLDANVMAVGVKSGNNTKSKSMKSLMSDKNRVPRGIKLERTNIYRDGSGVMHYPLFASAFLFGR